MRTPALTLVCLPYGGGSAAAYRPLVAELARTSPTTAVLAVELPGHDPARPDEALLSMPELTDRLVAELAEISGPDRAVRPLRRLGRRDRTGVAAGGGRDVRSPASSSAAVSPDARLPGRLLRAWWNTGFTARDRWASDRTQRDFLRTLGALDDLWISAIPTVRVRCCADCGTTSRRHRPWFSRAPRLPLLRGICAGSRRRCLCVIGERDRATELYQERYREWGAFADQVELATIPRAGHYFLKHQAETLARLIEEHLDRWAGGDLAPEPIGRSRSPARAPAESLRRLLHRRGRADRVAAFFGR